MSATIDPAATPAESGDSLYDADFYAWTQRQAALLRARRFSEVDIANLIEEVETLGRSEYRELVSRLEILLAHLLKWEFQAAKRSRSWRNTISEQRRRLDDHLTDNPSLSAKIPDALLRAYRHAKPTAAHQTSLPESTLPTAIPYSQEQLLDDQFWPGENNDNIEL